LLPGWGAGIDVVTDRYFIGGRAGMAKTPKNGATQPSIKWSPPSGLSLMDLVVDETDLYWLVHENQVSNVHIYAMPIDGESARLVASFRDGRRIVSYEDYLVVAKQTAFGGAISVVPKNGGDEQILVVTDPVTPVDIKVLGDSLYFSASNGGVYSIGLIAPVLKSYGGFCGTCASSSTKLRNKQIFKA
jgi:hypothetical protein